MRKTSLYLIFAFCLVIAPAMAQQHVVVTPAGKTDIVTEEMKKTLVAPKDNSDIYRPYYFFSDYGLTVGARLLTAKKYAAAISTFENVLDRNPRNIDALAGIGAAYLGLGQTKPAGDHIRKALARDNKHIGANHLYGRYYLQTGEVQQAVDQLTLLDMLCGQKYSCPEAASLEGEINAYKKQ